ncbi:MAG: hypothetical protein WCJ40_17465, partial [Planctomycetota bacterium]
IRSNIEDLWFYKMCVTTRPKVRGRGVVRWQIMIGKNLTWNLGVAWAGMGQAVDLQIHNLSH